MRPTRAVWPAFLLGLIGVSLVLWALTLSAVYRPVAPGNAATLARQPIFEAADQVASLPERTRVVRRPQGTPHTLVPPVASVYLPDEPESSRMLRSPALPSVAVDAGEPLNAVASRAAAAPAEQAASGTPSLRVLIVQTDGRTLGQGRATDLLLLHVDPAARRTQLLSLPAGIRVPDAATPNVTLGGSYTNGGLPATLGQVEHLTGRPVDAYLELSRGGLERLLDALGTVNVQATHEVRGRTASYPAGPLTLDRAATLDYLAGSQVPTASQPVPPDGGRSERARNVLDALIAGLSASRSGQTLLALPGLSGQVHTNLSPTELLRWRAAYPFLFTTQREVVDVNVIGREASLSMPDEERVRLYRTLK